MSSKCSAFEGEKVYPTIVGFDVNDIYPVPDTLPNQCGDAEHPWLEGDINRDCRTDIDDLRMLSYEWLTNNCD